MEYNVATRFYWICNLFCLVEHPDTTTFPGVKLDTSLIWKPQIEKMERSRNYLRCRLVNSDQSLHSNSTTRDLETGFKISGTTNYGVCIHYVGNGCQDQQKQAGQSPEHGPASHTWSHESHPSAWHGKNSQCRATWEEKRPQDPHPRRKTEKAAFPPSTHEPGTAHQQSHQAPKPEPPVQRTVQETPRDCGCANRAADRSCLGARQRGRHTHVSESPRHHLKGTTPWIAQKPHPCPDCWQIPLQCLDSRLHRRVLLEGNEKWRQRSLHQIARWWHPFLLGSWWSSVLQLSSWDTGHLHSCRAPVRERGKMRNITIFTDSLSTLQALQIRWSRACTPPLPSWQLSFQYPSSRCLLMWD